MADKQLCEHEEKPCNQRYNHWCYGTPCKKEQECQEIGLEVKYRVYKIKDNSLVDSCFVLRPDKDAAAVQALITYAQYTENKQLARDILNWIEFIKN